MFKHIAGRVHSVRAARQESIVAPGIAAMAGLIILTGCMSSVNELNNIGSAIGSKTLRVSVCKSGDTQIESANQCLQDDAACYELNTGKWCTGERGNTCPAGSVELPPGAACAPGRRCFQVSESLTCTII